MIYLEIIKGKVIKKVQFILGCTILIVIVILLRMRSRGKELANWIGDYIYVETFSRNDEEQNYYICFQITIYEENRTYYARIEGDGWFIQTDILACVKGDKDKIILTYLDVLPDDSLYSCGGKYQLGEELFELETVGHEIITSWKEFRREHPIFAENNEEIRGIFFEEIKDK